MRIFLIALSALFLFQAQAKATDPGLTCTLEGITDNCQVFTNSDSPELDMGNGTMVPNPLRGYGAEEDTTPSSSSIYNKSDPKADIKRRQAIAEAQVAIMKDPGLKASEEFKMALSDYYILTNIAAMETQGPQQYSAPIPNFIIPWPPNQKNFDIVPYEKFKKEYLSTLDQKTKTNILRQAQKASAANRIGIPSTRAEFQMPSFNKCMASLNDEAKCKGSSQPPIDGPTPKRIDEVRILAENARKLLIDEIRAGVRDEKLSDEQIFMIQKINSVKLNPNPEPRSTAECKYKNPNAFYNSDSHSFTICTDGYRLTNLDLVTNIAHELSHAIDSCNIYSTVFELNGKNTSLATLPEEVKRSLNSNQRKILTDIQAKQAKGQFLTTQFEDRKYAADIKWAIDEGYITRVGPTSPVRKQLPYQKAFDCILQNTSIRTITEKDMKKASTDVLRAQRAIYGLDTPPGKDVNDIKADLESHDRYCIKGNQTGETIADLWAAKVGGRYLEKTNNGHFGKSDAVKARGGWITGYACFSKMQNISGMDSIKDAHPFNRERLEQIFFQDPRVRKAFGCVEPRRNQCLSMLGTPTESADTTGPTGGVR